MHWLQFIFKCLYSFNNPLSVQVSSIYQTWHSIHPYFLVPHSSKWADRKAFMFKGTNDWNHHLLHHSTALIKPSPRISKHLARAFVDSVTIAHWTSAHSNSGCSLSKWLLYFCIVLLFHRLHFVCLVLFCFPSLCCAELRYALMLCV